MTRLYRTDQQLNSSTKVRQSHVLYSRFVLNPIQLEGSRRPLRLGSHVMLSKERASPSCGNIGPRAEFLYRVPSRLTRCSGSARTAVKLRFHYDLVHASREPSSRQGSFLGPCTPSTKPAVPPSEKRRGESKPTNLLLKRTLRPGSSGISIPLCRSSWASIADYRANPGRSCAAIRSKERGACHPTRFPLRTSSCGVNRFASLDRSTSLALLHACLFALSAVLLACLN